MRRRQVIRTTLGDLIAAVTDEVAASMENTSDMYVVVSYIVSDLLSRGDGEAQPCSPRPCLVDIIGRDSEGSAKVGISTLLSIGSQLFP
jgi:hypothetical protein